MLASWCVWGALLLSNHLLNLYCLPPGSGKSHGWEVSLPFYLILFCPTQALLVLISVFLLLLSSLVQNSSLFSRNHIPTGHTFSFFLPSFVKKALLTFLRERDSKREEQGGEGEADVGRGEVPKQQILESLVSEAHRSHPHAQFCTFTKPSVVPSPCLG